MGDKIELRLLPSADSLRIQPTMRAELDSKGVVSSSRLAEATELSYVYKGKTIWQPDYNRGYLPMIPSEIVINIDCSLATRDLKIPTYT